MKNCSIFIEKKTKISGEAEPEQILTRSRRPLDGEFSFNNYTKCCFIGAAPSGDRANGEIDNNNSPFDMLIAQFLSARESLRLFFIHELETRMKKP